MVYKKSFIHSQPQNHTLQGVDVDWPLSIPPKELRALVRQAHYPSNHHPERSRGIARVGSIIFSIFYIVSSSAAAYSQEESRNFFSSKFCTVFYENDINLKKVNIRVNPGFSNFYSPRSYKENPGILIEDIVSNKLDAIFNKAEEILDMYPAKIHVAINIYKTQEELNKVYEEFFNEPNKAVSFYIYKTNTIYVAESQLNENMLAHEMAHCIIDHYFIILPPRKIQEMLAVYVDLHLKD